LITKKNTSLLSAKRNGIVLILVLGILGLMSLMAVSFVSMTNLEKSISRNYVDKVRVQMVAESGMEAVISAIKNLEGGVLTASEMNAFIYYPQSNTPPLLKEATTPSLDLSNGTTGDGISGIVSSTYSLNGDFYKLKIEDESGKFNLNSSPGIGVVDRIYFIVERALTGLFGDAAKATNVTNTIFVTRDELGGRFLSMQDLYDVLVPANTGPVIDSDEWETLSSAFTVTSWFDDSVIEPTFSKSDFQTPGPKPGIMVTRGGSFFMDVWTILSSANGKVYYDSFTPWTTGEVGDIYCFMDTQTAHYTIGDPRAPVNINTCKKPLIAALIETVEGWYLEEGTHLDDWSRKANRSGPSEWFEDYQYGLSPWTVKWLYYDIDNSREMRLDRDNDPLYAGTLASMPEGGRAIGRNSIFGEIAQTADLGEALDPASIVSQLTDKIWERIHTGLDRNGDGVADEDPAPFTQWQEFGDFIRSLVDDSDSNDPITDDIIGFDYYQADAVLANFNPNTNINDYNPDTIIYKHIDKSHLMPGSHPTTVSGFTNEICFEPTGMMSILSMGFLRDTTGQTVARHSIKAVIRAFEYMRFTTQADFMEGYADDNPDPQELYFDTLLTTQNGSFSESDDIYCSAGADFDAAGNLLGRRGFSLMSYPEPITVAPFGNPDTDPPAWHQKWDVAASDYVVDDDWNYINDSIYDGYIGLATLQPTVSQAHSDFPPPFGRDPISIMNFNKTLRPSVLATGNAATAAMMSGFNPLNGAVQDPFRHANYPSNTFVRSTLQSFYYGITPVVMSFNMAEEFGVMTGAPTPGNYPTVDRLTYSYPDDATDNRQRMIPGVLHPDGALSDAGRTLTYHAANIGVNQGKRATVHMWIKPNFDPALASRIRTLFTIHRPFGGEIRGHLRPDAAESFECFFIPHLPEPDPPTTVTGGFAGIDHVGIGNLLFNDVPTWSSYCSIGVTAEQT